MAAADFARTFPWKLRRNELLPSEFEQRFGPLLGIFLWARGLVGDSEHQSFLNPRLEALKNPFTLQNLEAAAERLADAVQNQEAIVVYGDYDMDGMSGLALLSSFLRACGAEKVSSYQPDRLSEGYGVHPEAVGELAARGAKVIVTVDTGIAALAAAAEARRLGVSLIITDHHKQLLDELPDTPFIINPNQRSDSSGLTYLAGAGVALYLAIGVRSKLRARGHFQSQEPDLRQWLDLCVLGTVADHVELRGDNRVLVRAGLKQLLQTQRPGLRALLDRVLPEATTLSARDLAFSVAPKLNAASRLGKAELSTELLLTQDTLRARQLVAEIIELNEQRSLIQARVFEEAFVQAATQLEAHDAPVLVVSGHWHEGVLGVVAAKLVEKFGRPTIVLAELEGEEALLRGSMRTLPGFSCVRALDAAATHLRRYGGHTMAAGLQLRQEKLSDFREELWSAAREHLKGGALLPPLEYDGPLPTSLTQDAVEGLDATGPWGQGNPEPMYLLPRLDFGAVQVLSGQHVKGPALGGRANFIGFFKNSEVESVKAGGAKSFDALVTPEINRFRNTKSIQLRVHHVRAASDAPGDSLS